MQHRRTLLIVGLLLAVASLALAAFMLQPSAEDLLTSAVEAMELAAEEATSGHAIVEFNVDAPEMSATGTLELWGRMGVGPEGEPAFRAEVLSASMPEYAGMIAVSDGSQFWLWNPAENKVLTGTKEEMRDFIEAKMAAREGQFGDFAEGDFADKEEFADVEHPETPEEAVDKLLEYFTAERTGTERVGQEAAQAIRLIPIPEQMPDEIRAAGGLINIWLRAADNFPIGAAYTGGALGEAQAQATLLELNIDLDEALFTFDIPAGAEVVRLEDLQPQAVSPQEAADLADFDLLAPAGLPVEANLVEIIEVRGAIVQRYSKADGGSFTVTQGPAGANALPDIKGESVDVRGTTGMLFTNEAGDRTLLTWNEADFSVLIGGDLTAEQALALAESLQ